MRLVMALSCAVVLSACATQRQYQWGDYEQSLYEGYKDSSKMEALMQSLEANIGQLEKSNQKIPPGLYAELGTIYLQAGSQDQAIAMYGRDRDLWPESKGLMNALIQNLERIKNKDQGEESVQNGGAK